MMLMVVAIPRLWALIGAEDCGEYRQAAGTVAEGLDACNPAHTGTFAPREFQSQRRLAGYAATIDRRTRTALAMKTAEELLTELIEHVRPPKECPIKLKEWPANHITLRNWIAIRGDLVGPERERYDKKVTQLRQTDPQVDWSNVNSREGSRRVILFLDQDSVD